MESRYSETPNKERVILTLNSISTTIDNLIEWNKDISSTDKYYDSPVGMQLLAANCTLLTAIGEGVNRINRLSPNFLDSNFPEIPWSDIIGMRNRIAHGYFELDAEIILDVINSDIPVLQDVISKAINLCARD